MYWPLLRSHQVSGSDTSVENQPINANAESARMTGRNQRGAATGGCFTTSAGRLVAREGMSGPGFDPADEEADGQNGDANQKHRHGQAPAAIILLAQRRLAGCERFLGNAHAG